MLPLVIILAYVCSLISSLRLKCSLILDASPLVVFVKCLLEDKHKFMHGGVHKCHICRDNFSVWDSLLGINMHYFVVYAPISPIAFGFSLFGF